jgi:hypothetical protein
MIACVGGFALGSVTTLLVLLVCPNFAAFVAMMSYGWACRKHTLRG